MGNTHAAISSTRVGVVIVAVLLQSFVAIEWLYGQAQREATIEVNDPRPLAKAIEVVEQRFGQPITYEDSQVENANEIDDVTGAVRRDGNLNKRVLIPRGGPFMFRYVSPSDSSNPTEFVSILLPSLVATYHSYNNVGYPGRYAVLQRGDVFHIVPTGFRDKGGQDIIRGSVLESSISIPGATRTADEMIRKVLRLVTHTTGITVELGIAPVNLLRGTTVNEGATREVARDVLLRTLSATGRTLSWQLFYGPDTKTYAFNVHIVESSAP